MYSSWMIAARVKQEGVWTVAGAGWEDVSKPPSPLYQNGNRLLFLPGDGGVGQSREYFWSSLYWHQ